MKDYRIFQAIRIILILTISYFVISLFTEKREWAKIGWEETRIIEQTDKSIKWSGVYVKTGERKTRVDEWCSGDDTGGHVHAYGRMCSAKEIESGTIYFLSIWKILLYLAILIFLAIVFTIEREQLHLPYWSTNYTASERLAINSYRLKVFVNVLRFFGYPEDRLTYFSEFGEKAIKRASGDDKTWYYYKDLIQLWKSYNN